MSDELLLLKKSLREHGSSLTAPRQLVFELLLDEEPMSLKALLQKVNGRVDRVSVYRAIALFEKIGIIQRIYIGWKYKLELSDTFSHHHHHMTCLKCGTLIPLHEDNELEAYVQSVATKHGMIATRHQIEIQGICQSCQKQIAK